MLPSPGTGETDGHLGDIGGDKIERDAMMRQQRCRGIGFATQEIPFTRRLVDLFLLGEELAAHGGRRGPQVDGQANGELGEKLVMGIMFSQENEHRLVEDAHITQRLGFGAFALIMNDAQGQIIVVPAGKGHAVGEVYVLAIHEELLVEQAAAVERGTPQQHESSRKHIDAIYLIFVEITQMIAPETRAAGKYLGQPENLAERDPR